MNEKKKMFWLTIYNDGCLTLLWLTIYYLVVVVPADVLRRLHQAGEVEGAAPVQVHLGWAKHRHRGRCGAKININPFFPTVPTCAVRETASLGIMGIPRVPPLNPSESIVF